MLFPLVVDAADDNDVLNLSMSSEKYDIQVSKDFGTIFMLPMGQRLLEINGGDVVLDVEGTSSKNIETNDWVVSIIRKRGTTVRNRWIYHYNVKIKPKRDVPVTDFVFVTDQWVHRVSLAVGSNPSSVVIINDDSFLNMSCFMDWILHADPILLLCISVLLVIAGFVLYR